MAKHIRSIKADLCDDETLGECSRDARFLFVGLITRVDDHGRFRANPSLIRSRIYPYDEDVTNADVARWLGELEAKGRIYRYAADGQQYLVLTKWGKHQRIDNAAKSELPPPPDPIPPQAAATSGEPPLEGKGTEGNGTEGNGTVELALVSASPTAALTPVDAVFFAWQQSTGHHKAVLDKKRKTAITAALKHYPPEDLIDACRGVMLFPHNRGETNGTRYDDLCLVLRDSEHIERFRDRYRGEDPPAPRMPKGSDLTARNLARLESNGSA